MNQTRACGLSQRVPQGESAPWLGVLEPHDAASHRDEPAVPSSFGQNSVITKLADPGEQRTWLDAGGGFVATRRTHGLSKQNGPPENQRSRWVFGLCGTGDHRSSEMEAWNCVYSMR